MMTHKIAIDQRYRDSNFTMNSAASRPLLQSTIMENGIPLRPYSYKELTALYGISQRTLKTWLTPFMQEIGEKHSRYFTVRQVRIIFEKLGLPGYITED